MGVDGRKGGKKEKRRPVTKPAAWWRKDGARKELFMRAELDKPANLRRETP